MLITNYCISEDVNFVFLCLHIPYVWFGTRGSILCCIVRILDLNVRYDTIAERYAVNALSSPQARTFGLGKCSVSGKIHEYINKYFCRSI